MQYGPLDLASSLETRELCLCSAGSICSVLGGGGSTIPFFKKYNAVAGAVVGVVAGVVEGVVAGAVEGVVARVLEEVVAGVVEGVVAGVVAGREWWRDRERWREWWREWWSERWREWWGGNQWWREWWQIDCLGRGTQGGAATGGGRDCQGPDLAVTAVVASRKAVAVDHTLLLVQARQWNY